MTRPTLILLAMALVAATLLAGCAKPREMAFDVPSAVPAPKNAAATEGSVDRAAGEIAAAVVLFAFDRAEIRPEAIGPLDRVAALLKQNPTIRISLQGHCDERGSREYNFGLGERRSRAVYAYLLNAGVPTRQVAMVTYGKLDPIMPGRTAEDFAQNRRVVFAVLTTCL